MKRLLCAALCGLMLVGLAPGQAASAADAAEETVVTRGEFCVSLWEAVGSPSAEEVPFTDLSPAADPDTARAAAYFYAIGVTNGCGETKFCPGEPLTLEQAVTMSSRFAACCGVDTVTAEDSRASVSNWARGAMGWALAMGLVTAAEDPLAALTAARAGQLVAYLAPLAMRGEESARQNPMEDSSFEGVSEQLSLQLYAPVGAWNLRYAVIDGRVAQLRFMLHESEYCYRAAYGSAEDLSGVYFHTGVNVPAGVAYCSGWFCSEDDAGSRLWWYDDEASASFSLSCSGEATAEALAACAAELYLYTMKSAVFSLEMKAGTGYSWHLTHCDRSVLAVSEPLRLTQAAETAKPAVGGPETYRWAVAGLQPGVETNLTMAYFRRWEGVDAAEDIVNYTVAVDKDYNVTLVEAGSEA